MKARILLASGEIIEVEDVNSVMQFNRRAFKEQVVVKIPVQVSALCDPGNPNGKNFDCEDVLKIELLFPPSDNRHLLKGTELKYKYPYGGNEK